MERELERLQDGLEAGMYSVSTAGPATGTPGTEPAAKPVEVPKPIRPEAVPEDVREIVASWKHIEQSIVASGHQLLGAKLTNVLLSVDEDGSLVLGFRERLERDYFSGNPEKVEQLREIIGEATGKQVKIVVKDVSDAKDRVGITDLRDIIKNVPIEVKED